MKIIEVDTEQFNGLRFDKYELFTEDEEVAVDWAKEKEADVLWKYDRANGTVYFVEVA